jgi:hypothetical protein
VTDEETKNKVIVTITITICTFLLLSLVGTFALEWAGKEAGTVWSRIFDLIGVLAGALVGYIAGQQVEKSRHGNAGSDSAGLDVLDSRPAVDDDEGGGMAG